MEDFQIIQPSSLLAPYVKQYWFLKTENVSQQQRIIPNGSVSLIFHRENKLFSISENEIQPQAFISGQSIGYSDLLQTGVVDIISVMLHPHGAKAFFPMSISELYDSVVSINDIDDIELKELQDKLMYTIDIQSSIQLIETYLLKRLYITKNYNYQRMSTVIQSINLGQINIGHLAQISCLSYKQFKRIFLEYVGANPKDFLRIVRFQRTLYILQSQPQINFTQLAFECGYYDQPHLIREFRSFSGYTPAEYLAICAPYSDYFTQT